MRSMFWKDIFELSKNVPLRIGNFPRLHFIPATLRIHIQYQFLPCLRCFIFAPQNLHWCSEAIIPISPRNCSIYSSLLTATRCRKPSYDICSVIKSCLYIASIGWTFCKNNGRCCCFLRSSFSVSMFIQTGSMSAPVTLQLPFAVFNFCYLKHCLWYQINWHVRNQVHKEPCILFEEVMNVKWLRLCNS